MSSRALTEVQDASGADAVRLRDLHVTTWADTYRGLLAPGFYAERLVHHRLRDWERLVGKQAEVGGGVLVAREAEALLGLCQYGPTEDEDDSASQVGHIHRLYVHPAAQGRGVGTALLGAATARLSRDGARSLTLWALGDDPRARVFYEHRGWYADGARRFDGALDVRYRRAPAQDPTGAFRHG
ncbi:MAG TPA: GNAT family N-acetyltransferase [Solirubrobacteraceae bacterium]|nr:GNAT family N-acetyltransferase [Solirubrobacteraceae bacterium]